MQVKRKRAKMILAIITIPLILILLLGNQNFRSFVVKCGRNVQTQIGKYIYLTNADSGLLNYPIYQVSKFPLIMHGGGAYNNLNYSNSREAIEYNYKKGSIIFELDFELTSDGYIILKHDSYNNYWNEGKSLNEIFIFSDFKETKYKGILSILTVDDLINLMFKYPNLVIITDYKYESNEDYIDFYNLLFEKVPDILEKRFIYQSYEFEHIDYFVKEGRGSQTIFSNYRLQYTNFAEIIKMCIDSGVGEIVITNNSIDYGYIELATKYGVKIYSYPINSIQDLKAWHKKGVSGVYSDDFAGASYLDVIE